MADVAAPTDLRYRLETLDCADCARTVEGALGRVPGVRGARVDLGARALHLVLDEATTSRADVERRLRDLGYPPTPDRAATAPDPDDPAWHRTGKGRAALATGALVAAAASAALALPALAPWLFAAATLVGVAPLARRSWARARAGNPFTIDTLVALAALGAVAIGEAAEGALVVFLFAVGEVLEQRAAGRARAGIRALAALAPATARRREGAGVVEVRVEALRVGDLVEVRPGDRVPADAVVVAGRADVDASAITGESVPVPRAPGEPVAAGSVAVDGMLVLRVERAAADSTVARVRRLVEEAARRKAPVARYVDRFARRYTPLAMAVAALVMVLPPLVAGAPWDAWVYRGLAVLLIACPCALVLSVPAAITAGIAAAARQGLLVKGGATLEAIGGVRTVAFDKTGTLTANRPEVVAVEGFGVDPDEVLRLAAAVERGSAHPIARAVLARAGDRPLPEVRDARALPGRAATATVEGRALAVGSPRHAAELAPLPAAVRARVDAVEGDGATAVLLLDDGAPLGLFAVRDAPRADAAAALARLARAGVRTVVLTGDHARAGAALGRDLGVDVRAELMPDGKLAALEALRRDGPVAMVGDGINDAPALARADVSVAMGGGTDVALETADAALLHERVAGVADLVDLSRATMRVVRQNVAFALGLKAVFLVTTVLGVTGLWPAILSDSGATVLVTANALRLLRFRPTAAAAASPSPHAR